MYAYTTRTGSDEMAQTRLAQFPVWPTIIQFVVYKALLPQIMLKYMYVCGMEYAALAT